MMVLLVVQNMEHQHIIKIFLLVSPMFKDFGQYLIQKIMQPIPVLPQWTITGATGSFTKGELITGSTSGAIARIVNTLSPITYVSINEVDFTSGETITGSREWRNCNTRYIY
jgi:hypothetical protein